MQFRFAGCRMHTFETCTALAPGVWHVRVTTALAQENAGPEAS